MKSVLVMRGCLAISRYILMTGQFGEERFLLMKRCLMRRGVLVTRMMMVFSDEEDDGV